MNTTTTTPHQPLNRETARDLVVSFQRYRELKSKSVLNPNEIAELDGTTAHLQSQLLEHAAEFINCWYAVVNEFEPLIGVFAAIQRRVSVFNQPATAPIEK
jgi:hypothetical protein